VLPPAARAALLGALALAALAAPARPAALDRFEIQVYEPDLEEPGGFALELHSNYTVEGARRAAHPGEIPPHRTARFTLEPALGVTSWLEVGAYGQMLVAPAEGARFAGVKLRAKMVAPRSATGERFFLGLNVELGRVPVAVEEEGWANELRPFLGYRDRWLLVDLNPILGYALTGRDKFRVDLEPAVKVSVNTQLGFAIGAEYYAELGFVDAIKPLRDQAHYLFGVVDLVAAPGRPDPPIELNVALGGGVTAGADQAFIVKTIVGRSF
jgi:hypothetical protein